MEKFLFLFTIAPVQSFIAQARKTQDLYSGSLLLSTLIKEAAEQLGQLSGVQKSEIIFPDFGNIKSAPNRFIAEIECDNLSKTGKALKEYVLEQFRKKANAALGNTKINAAQGQVDNFLQVYWAAVPHDGMDYMKDYDRLEKLMAAVKNTRIFKQYHQPLGLKCSLCGERVAIIHRYSKNRIGRTATGAQKLPDTDNRLIVNEGLCAVCWTKRASSKWSGGNTEFPSTAGIALTHSLEKLKIEFPMVKESIKFLLNADHQLIYPENLTKSYFEKHDIDFDLAQAQRHLNAIRDAAKSKDIYLPKYYALVMLDGDNVGDWMAGRLHDKTKFPDDQLRQFHEGVTNKLGGYAKAISDYFEDKILGASRGKLVYAGGDDVLAFVNLFHLTETLERLRDNIPQLDGTGKYTASAGVVIAHYKIPLSEVLKWAHITEKKAKNELDANKDKLAISVLKHSGEIVQCTTPWEIDDSYLQLRIFDTLIELWDKNVLSSKFIQVLLETFYKLIDDDSSGNGAVHSGIIHWEIKRTIQRSFQQKDNDIFKDRVKSLKSNLCSLYDHIGVENFISYLRIVDFVYRRTRSWL